MNMLAAWLLLGIYLTLVFHPGRVLLTRLSRCSGDWTVLLLLPPYLLAVNLQPTPGELLRLILFLTLPTLCLRWRSCQARPGDLLQFLAILALWIPVEADLFVLPVDLLWPERGWGARLASFLGLPGVGTTLLPGVELPVSKLTAISLALFLFLVHHPLPGVGFTFRLRLKDWQYALQGLLAYAVIGLPLGLGVGFLHFHPLAPSPLHLLAGILGGYFLVALVEEMLFRGAIQNLLAQRLGKERAGWLIASLIFGLAHLNDATPGFAVPNWAYVLMATPAGMVYGWVWRRTGKVTVSALTHMLVNLAWGLLFFSP